MCVAAEPRAPVFTRIVRVIFWKDTFCAREFSEIETGGTNRNRI